MKMKYPVSILITALFLCATPLLAQDTKPTDPKKEPAKGTMTEEIEVVRPYKPVLANAAKIRRNPDLNDTKPFKQVLTYNILDKKLALNTDIRQLQYQQLATISEPAPENNYLKLGMGNLKTGQGEIYLNTGSDEALQAGVFAKHLSQAGKINKQQFSEQELGIFGKNISENFTLSGKADYKRLGTYFYGTDPLALINTEPAKQQLSVINLEGELANRYSTDPSQWAYALKADASLFRNKLQARENTVALSAFANKNADNFNFGGNTSIDLTTVKDQNYSIGNHLFRFNPYAKYMGQGFSLTLGINAVMEFGNQKRQNILPALSLEAPIVPNSAVIFAGLGGDVKKTSLKETAFENPYLDQNIEIKNAIEKSNIYAGIKGNLGFGFGFKAMAYFKTVQDLPLLINLPTDRTKYGLIYDTGNSKITGFEAEIDIKATDIFSMNARLITANYKLNTEEKAWFKPGFRLETEARAQVNKHLALNATLVFNGDTYANDGSNTPIKIKNYTDLSAGANYQVNKKWGVYLQANNVLGTIYQQYLYYPKLGLNIFGGINYSF